MHVSNIQNKLSVQVHLNEQILSLHLIGDACVRPIVTKALNHYVNVTK